MRSPQLPAVVGLVTFLVLATPVVRANGARIVEAPALPPFTDLQAAVDAAADGDTIVVAAGTYEGFTIDGKALRVVGVPGQAVSVAGTITVRNLAAGGTVLLSGLAVVGQTQHFLSDTALLVDKCAGHVRVEACTLEGGAGYIDTFDEYGAGGRGVVLQASQRVVLSHCDIRGGAGGGDDSCYDCEGGNGGHAAVVQGSVAAVYECTFLGGEGGTIGYNAGDGGHGALVVSGGILAAGSAFTGGDGGDAWDFIAANGGDGGDGLRVESAAQAQLLDDTFAGGARGTSFLGPAHHGQPGAPTAGSGVINIHPGPARRASAYRLTFDGSNIQVAVGGEPGDKVWLWSGPTPQFWPFPGIPGVRLVRVAPVLVQPAGVIPGSGQLLITIPAPALDLEPARLLHLQIFGYDLDGQFWIGSPGHALVLDREAAPDCNGNLQSDLADTLLGVSADCGPNLVPDECDPDCDGNGVPDDCDLAAGTQLDCNGNGVPDACDIASGTSLDCNGNAVPDSCDIASGTSADVNGNGIPDECEPMTTWWVDAAAPAGGNGSVAAPFQAIGQAMAAAIGGDEIVVRDGTYTGAGNREMAFGGRELVVRSENGAASCVLDLQDAGRAFLVDGGVGRSSRIEGFTFLDGNAFDGGAISVSLSHPVIRNCVFASCTTGSQGGAIYLGASGALIEGCSFRFNSTTGPAPWSGFGGAICFTGNVGTPPPTAIRSCRFESNTANDGGAIFTTGAFPLTISHSLFLGNAAAHGGGAVANRSWGSLGGKVALDDCLLVGNTSGEDGGALYVCSFVLNYQTVMDVTACTFEGNTAVDEGGAISVEFASTTRVLNSILWNNSAAFGGQLALDDEGNVTWGIPHVSVERCDVQGGQAAVNQVGGALTWAAGNLDVDPQFADPDGPDNDPLTYGDNDYRPIPGSPVNDAGDNALVPPDLNDIDGDNNIFEPTPLDLDLTPRFVDDPLAPDVGAGTPPLVDMGCYENG